VFQELFLTLDEVEGDGEEIQLRVGKNTGVQFIPFTVKVAPETKSYYVAFNAVSFKNMNSYIGKSGWYGKASGENWSWCWC
jgi:hypothetical protein